MKTLRIEEVDLGPGMYGVAIGEPSYGSDTCNCGNPVMIGETGCETCMTHTGMLEYLLRNHQWDRCMELQERAGRDLTVILGGHELPLTLCVEEGRKL